MSTGNPFKRAITFLEDSDVPYVIVGGFAVVMHGCNRFTPDLNVMIAHDDDGLRRLAEQLCKNDFVATTELELLFSADSREALFENGKRWFFSFRDLEEPSFSLDLFLHFPVPFQQVQARSTKLSFSDGTFSVCSLEDLVAMKSIAGRGQDKADIGALGLIKSIQAKIEAGAGEQEIVTMGANDAEGEQIEGFYRFMKLSPDEKLDWLEQMLSYLGKFCVG